MSINPYEQCPSDTDTLESLGNEIGELNNKLDRIIQFLDDHFDAGRCEHCGAIHKRSHMLAAYGVYVGSDGKPRPKSSRWFCGWCMDAARMWGGNQPEVRERIGRWLALGFGRKFLREMDLGYPADQRAPVGEHLRQEYAAEIEKAARRSR